MRLKKNLIIIPVRECSSKTLLICIGYEIIMILNEKNNCEFMNIWVMDDTVLSENFLKGERPVKSKLYRLFIYYLWHFALIY